MKEVIEIGKIVSTRGLDGTIKVFSDFNSSDFVNLKTMIVDNKNFNVRKISKSKNFLYINFEEIKNIDEAKNLINFNIYVKRENIKLEKDEYLIEDLLNMQVFTNDGNYLGDLVNIENFGSKDVYTIKNNKVEQSFCLIEKLIESVDYENNKIILNSKLINEVLVWK